MSWTLTCMITSPEVKSFADIKADFVAAKIADRAQVIRLLNVVLPGWDFSRPWGYYEDHDFSLTAHLVSQDGSEAIHIVRFAAGGGELVIPTLLQIGKALGCFVFDDSTGWRIDETEHPEHSLEEWQRYRDMVMRRMMNRKNKLDQES